MKTSPPAHPLFADIKKHRRYLLPTWIFEVYFIAWGMVCGRLKLQPNFLLLLFFVTVAPPFFGTFLWASQIRKHVSYWRFCVLTMVIPALIFVASVLLLAVLQALFG